MVIVFDPSTKFADVLSAVKSARMKAMLLVTREDSPLQLQYHEENMALIG